MCGIYVARSNCVWLHISSLMLNSTSDVAFDLDVSNFNGSNFNPGVISPTKKCVRLFQQESSTF